MWLSTSYYDSGVDSVGTSQSAQEGQSRQRSERGHQGCGGRSGHQRWRCLPSSANHTCADSALVAVMGKVRWPQVRRLQRWFFPISCSAPADATSGSRTPLSSAACFVRSVLSRERIAPSAIIVGASENGTLTTDHLLKVESCESVCECNNLAGRYLVCRFN